MDAGCRAAQGMNKSPHELAEELADALLKIDRLKSLLAEFVSCQVWDGGNHPVGLNPPSHSLAIRARMMLAES